MGSFPAKAGSMHEFSGACRSALGARLERGAAIEVGERAAQPEVFQGQFVIRLREAALGPACVSQDIDHDIEAALLHNQNAAAVRMTLVDVSFVPDGFLVAHRDNFSGEKKTVRVADVAALTRTNHGNIGLWIRVRSDGGQVQAHALICGELRPMRFERIVEQPSRLLAKRWWS